MSGIKALRRIQLASEGSTSGTAQAATVLWRGMGALNDDREVVFVEEDIGYLSGVDRTYVPRLSGAITFDETPATFEQLPYILEASIKAVGTGTADTGGSGVIYEYDMPTTSANTVQSYTVEGGDNQQEEEMYYGVVESFSLSGAGGEALNMSAEWIGRQVQKGTFTTQPAVPTVEEILFSKGKIYIDTAGGTIGSTQVSDTLLAATVNYNSGLIRKWTADGSLDFSFVQTTMPELTIDVTYEHNSSAVTEKDAYRDQDTRLIRLDFEGSTLTTAGSSHSVKLLRIDAAAKYESVDALGDQDGNSIVTASLRARYSPTASLFASVTVVNELSSLT